MRLRTKDVFGTEGNSGMGRSGGGSGIEYESCRFLREALGK